MGIFYSYLKYISCTLALDKFRLTMSENVDCFVVQIKEGFDTANPIGRRPVVTQDVLVKSQVAGYLMYLQQPAVLLFGPVLADPFFGLMIMLHCVFHQHDCVSTVVRLQETKDLATRGGETRDDPQIL